MEKGIKPGSMSDAELLRRAGKGDEEAFAELAVRYEKFVFSVAFDVVRSREDASDASQDALLKLWRTASSWRGGCEVKTWIYRIAKTSALDVLRSRASRVSVPFDEAFAEVEDDAPQPDEAAERKEDVSAVRAAIDSLPEQYREVIVMRELQDMSYKEIAEAAGIDIGTVKSRLSRARAELFEKLRDKIGKGGTKPPPHPSKQQTGK